MAIKKYKPTSNGRRGMTVSDFAEITTSTPEKSLLAPLKSKGGRNNQGKLTVRHQGGGHKRSYRIIDFKRDKDGIPGRVATVEYDPNRSANIALINYVDGEKRYIIAPKNIQVGAEVMSGPEADIKVGNALPLVNIPVGTVIHNIELKPGKGGSLSVPPFFINYLSKTSPDFATRTFFPSTVWYPTRVGFPDLGSIGITFDT